MAYEPSKIDVDATRVRETMRTQKIVDDAMRRFSELQAYRSQRAWQWEESASLGMPSMRNTFFYGNYNFPGIKKTQLQVDSTVMLANWKFGAICDAMMTPFSTQWHILKSTNPYINKNRASQLFFEQLSHTLAELRNSPSAAFRRNNQTIWQMVGMFGNAPMFVDQDVDHRGSPLPGLRYMAIPVGQPYIETNHQGKVIGFCRWFRLTAGQALNYPQWLDKLPEGIKKAAEKGSEAPFDFLHRVCPNEDYDPGRKDHRGKLYSSYYISLTGRTLLSEGGYRTFPMPYCRYMQNPEDPYADGPAQLILPTLKTINAEKGMFLKVGHRTADPILLGPDDGLVDPSLIPGAYNKGGVSPDGKPMIHPLEFGNIQISKEMMDEERAIIGSAFFTDLFANLQDPRMTATQVVELINQKGMFMAPMAGATGPEYLGSMIEREIDIMKDINLGMGGRLIPQVPPILIEAMRAGEHRTKIEYTSPLFKGARAGDAAGFLRTVESVLEVAGQMSDPSLLDPFNFKVAIPAIADIQSVPPSWMASPDEMVAKAKIRQQQQAAQQQIQALPAQAAMLKARAVVAKNTGQSSAPNTQPQNAPQYAP